VLPREVLKWLQVLRLSAPVKTPRRDCANGYLVAEILHKYYPDDVSLHSFSTGTAVELKLANWGLIQKVGWPGWLRSLRWVNLIVVHAACQLDLGEAQAGTHCCRAHRRHHALQARCGGTASMYSLHLDDQPQVSSHHCSPPR
jgi:hypothetical protein